MQLQAEKWGILKSKDFLKDSLGIQIYVRAQRLSMIVILKNVKNQLQGRKKQRGSENDPLDEEI